MGGEVTCWFVLFLAVDIVDGVDIVDTFVHFVHNVHSVHNVRYGLPFPRAANAFFK